MSEKSVTLLELHLGDGDVRIGPNTLFGGTDDAAADTSPDGDGVGVETNPVDGEEADGPGAARVSRSESRCCWSDCSRRPGSRLPACSAATSRTRPNWTGSRSKPGGP